MILEDQFQENPFSNSRGSLSPLYRTHYEAPISDTSCFPTASFVRRVTFLSKTNPAKLYAIAAIFLIAVGFFVISSSLNVSANQSFSPPLSPAMPVSLKSPQWSGYVVMPNLILRTSEVTIVTGSWTVPAIEPTVKDRYSSVWVGIGGYGEKSLIQTGTAQQSVNGIVEYYAWYELLPNHAVRIKNFTVQPGDEITASVKLINPATNIWKIQLQDRTTGESFSINISYKSSKLSAEWVVEAPSIGGNITTLADFGNVTFKGCFATIAKTTGTISEFPGYQLVMYDNQDVQLVDVSSLKAEGASFTVTYSKTTVTGTD